MARLDQQPELRFRNVDVSRLVRDAAEDLRAQQPDRPIKVAADGAVLVRTPGAPLPPSGKKDVILTAVRDDGDSKVLYEFLTRPPEQVAEGAEVIHLHSIFTTVPGLDEVASG